MSDAGTAPASARTTTRIGTWNIRWYPDGRPGKKAATPGTDIFWLACAIAWLEVDILAVQEIKTLPRAQKQTEELLAELKRLTGQTWQAAFDDCPQQATQHVGLLWNEERVRVSNQRTEAAFNPHGAPCQDALRPGFAALVELADGSRFELISVHLKSGAERRSFDLRAKSFGALAEVLAAGRTRQPNLDMVVAGDFNTMGCKKCSPQVTADQELAQASAKWAQSSLHWLSPEPGCTEYYRDKGHLLDGFVVTAGLTARVKQPVRVAGLCGELACKGPRAIGLSPAMRRLSDHCPVVLELSGAPPATTDGTGAK